MYKNFTPEGSFCAIKLRDKYCLVSNINIIQNYFTLLKKSPMLNLVNFPPTKALGNHKSVHCFCSFSFSKMSDKLNDRVLTLFRLAFHLTICIWDAFMSLHGLVFHFLLSSYNILLYGCIVTCLSTIPTKYISVACGLGQLWIRVL